MDILASGGGAVFTVTQKLVDVSLSRRKAPTPQQTSIAPVTQTLRAAWSIFIPHRPVHQLHEAFGQAGGHPVSRREEVIHRDLLLAVAGLALLALLAPTARRFLGHGAGEVGLQVRHQGPQPLHHLHLLLLACHRIVVKGSASETETETNRQVMHTYCYNYRNMPFTQEKWSLGKQ